MFLRALLLSLCLSAAAAPTNAPAIKPPVPVFTLTCPFPNFRVDQSSDLKSWVPRAMVTGGIVVIIDVCEPADWRFFRVVPLTAPLK